MGAPGVASRMQTTVRMGLPLSVGAGKCINILFPPAPCEGSHKQNALEPVYCHLGTRALGLFWLLEIGAALLHRVRLPLNTVAI